MEALRIVAPFEVDAPGKPCSECNSDRDAHPDGRVRLRKIRLRREDPGQPHWLRTNMHLVRTDDGELRPIDRLCRQDPARRTRPVNPGDPPDGDAKRRLD